MKGHMSLEMLLNFEPLFTIFKSAFKRSFFIIHAVVLEQVLADDVIGRVLFVDGTPTAVVTLECSPNQVLKLEVLFETRNRFKIFCANLTTQMHIWFVLQFIQLSSFRLRFCICNVEMSGDMCEEIGGEERWKVAKVTVEPRLFLVDDLNVAPQIWSVGVAFWALVARDFVNWFRLCCLLWRNLVYTDFQSLIVEM